jgi:16S rRNA (uracil1498-N3)-methyltransferase
MRTPRIYHEGLLAEGQSVVVSPSAASHLTRVLRLSAGDEIVLFNGDGNDYAAVIESVTKRGLSVGVRSNIPVRGESPARITLIQGICRGQKMDLVVQKATELGVGEIVPVLCARTVIKLTEERGERRRAHWQAIAVNACEQSGRAVLPVISAPTSLREALARLTPGCIRLVLDPTGQPLASRADPGEEPVIALLIGPEGGLTAAELELAARDGFIGTRLGPRILRTETAPLAALSVLQYLWGDLGPGGR